jgi:hypothetical protein
MPRRSRPSHPKLCSLRRGRRSDIGGRSPNAKAIGPGRVYAFASLRVGNDPVDQSRPDLLDQGFRLEVKVFLREDRPRFVVDGWGPNLLRAHAGLQMGPTPIVIERVFHAGLPRPKHAAWRSALPRICCVWAVNATIPAGSFWVTCAPVEI